MFNAVNVTLGSNVSTPQEAMHAVGKLAASTSSSSLAEYTAPTRLAPRVLIDNSLLNSDPIVVKSLLHTLLSIFTANYLRAVNMDLAGVSALQILDKFATDREVMRAMSVTSWIGNESMIEQNCFIAMEAIDHPKHELPRDWSKLKKNWGLEGLLTVSEYDVDRIEMALENYGGLAGVGATSDERSQFKNKDNFDTIIEETNLAVGKLIEVRMRVNNHGGDEGSSIVSIPVQAVLIPQSITPEGIVTITAATGVDTTMKGRWHAMRSGEIKFLRDYIFNLDLLEDHKKSLVADKTGTLFAAGSKRMKGILAAIASGRASPNSVSSMMIVSKDTARKMELVMNGKKLSKVRDREEYFKSNILATLVVVDPIMERFTLYQRGIAEEGSYTFSDIKGNNSKANGVDMEAVMKAYKLGESAPL